MGQGHRDNCDDQDQAEDALLIIRANPGQHQTVVQNDQQKDAKSRTQHSAFTAVERRATDDGGGNDGEKLGRSDV